MASHERSTLKVATFCLLSVLSIVPSCMAATRVFEWEISFTNFTRNCVTKPLLVVNGQFPGPIVQVSEGDHVRVRVKNSGNENVTIHWHGILQFKSCWSDGTGYITECPIQPGNVDVYEFDVTDQRGTTFWHSHVAASRATVYGAFITLPKNGLYPFAKPYKEIPILLGEWWNTDIQALFRKVLEDGGSGPVADAVTINGLPGPQYNCSQSEGLTVIDVVPGKTYLLRVINAALESQLFFAIANHSLTVVEADSEYVKPFVASRGIVVGPGQTMNVLVTADQCPGNYFFFAKPHSTLWVTDFSQIPPESIATLLRDTPDGVGSGLFRYPKAPDNATFFPTNLPVRNDTAYTDQFENSLRSLDSGKVPRSANVRHLFYPVGFSSHPCTPANPCNIGPFRFGAMVSNISLLDPTISILQAYYYNISGVYSPTFPDRPVNPFNYSASSAPPIAGAVSELATRVTVLEYGTVVEIVLQNTNAIGFLSHPFHLHGHFFYVLGRGYGNYDAAVDRAKLNFRDPPARFTINTPTRGWVAIRFRADNPGVWLFHCHLEMHTLWGMSAVFIVKDGKTVKLPGPSKRLNQC